MNRTKTRIAVLLIAAMAASGCSVFKKGTPKTPVLGTRVAVLTTENDVVADPATAAPVNKAVARTAPFPSSASASRRLGTVAILPAPMSV